MIADGTQSIHATAVQMTGGAALITGASGSGKSSLALQLLSLGAGLIADDRCALYSKNDTLWVRKPEELPALIEARGIGLLPVKLAGPAQVRLVIDMDTPSEHRLPEDEVTSLLGHNIKMIRKIEGSYFPAAISLYLKADPAS